VNATPANMKLARPVTRALFGATVLALSISVIARAQGDNEKPKLLQDVGIVQRLNEQVPLDLAFHDESDRTVRLRDYFGKKPAILAMVYYECPMLCTEVLNGLLASLKNMPLDVGKQFNVVTVSFNPREKPGLAANKKRVYVGLYGRPKASEGWHFLTGDEAEIRQLARAVGFHYAYDRESDQFAHAAAIMVLTPQGRISRYFFGIDYPSRDLRLSLVEASGEKIGSPVDEILLYCYHYDPTTGKYGLVVANAMRMAGLATILVLGSFLLVMFWRERQVLKKDLGARI